MTIKPPREGESLDATYDASFFKLHEPFRGAYALLASLIREIAPADASSVIDVGCGHCILLEELSKHFSEARGIEGSTSGIHPDLRERVAIVDMAQSGWGTTTDTRASVIVTLETAEHLPPQCSDEFVAALVAHQPQMVVFSAATPYQDLGQNPTHVNEQPLTYWVEKFESNGYALSTRLSKRVRATLQHSGLFARIGWYQKNILIFTPGPSEATSFSAQDFIYSSNPIFQLIFERDRLEFENLVLKREFKPR